MHSKIFSSQTKNILHIRTQSYHHIIFINRAIRFLGLYTQPATPCTINHYHHRPGQAIPIPTHLARIKTNDRTQKKWIPPLEIEKYYRCWCCIQNQAACIGVGSLPYGLISAQACSIGKQTYEYMCGISYVYWYAHRHTYTQTHWRQSIYLAVDIERFCLEHVPSSQA